MDLFLVALEVAEDALRILRYSVVTVIDLILCLFFVVTDSRARLEVSASCYLRPPRSYGRWPRSPPPWPG